MKRIFLFLWLMSVVAGAIQLPAEIRRGFEQSKVPDGMGVSVHGTDREGFIKYICENWKDLIGNVDEIPPSAIPFDTPEQARNYSLYVFSATCEFLPPQEYTSFLNSLTTLYEQGKIPLDVMNSAINGCDEKEYFVAVNWEDSRIQGILSRLIAKTPKAEGDIYNGFVGLSKGRFATSYRNNKPDNAPLPQTLPGIKLRDPEVGFLKKARDAIRPSHAQGDSNTSSEVKNGTAQNSSILANLGWPVWTGGIIALATGFVLILKRKGKR